MFLNRTNYFKLPFLLFFIFIFCSCSIPKLVIAPSDPDISSSKSDYHGINLYIRTFSVQTSKPEDNYYIEDLKRKLIEYIRNENEFKEVIYSSSNLGFSDNNPYISMDIQLTPSLTIKRTYILDAFFIYPGLFFMWPITPQWGDINIRLTSNFFDMNGKNIRSFSYTCKSSYNIIFYSWYRSGLIENKFKKCYKETFDKLAKELKNNNKFFVSSINFNYNILPVANINNNVPSTSRNYIDPKIYLPKFNGKQLLLAVLDLKADIDKSKELAAPLSNALRESLMKTGYFKIVDRASMDSILKEQSFSLTDCTSNECVIQIGKLLAVDRIVTGGISRIGDSWYLSASVTNVESGVIETTESETCNCPEEDLLLAVNTLAKKLAIGYSK